MITLTLIIFILYSAIEGIREGYYYHYKWLTSIMNKHDEHSMFTIQRVIVVLGLSIISYPLIGWYCFLSIISMSLCFSFIHNGMYYSTRNSVDKNVYKRKFFDDTTSSTAKISMNFPVRTGLFVLGTVGAIVFDIIYFTILI